jgi:hypothetical protein
MLHKPKVLNNQLTIPCKGTAQRIEAYKEKIHQIPRFLTLVSEFLKGVLAETKYI